MVGRSGSRRGSVASSRWRAWRPVVAGRMRTRESARRTIVTPGGVKRGLSGCGDEPSAPGTGRDLRSSPCTAVEHLSSGGPTVRKYYSPVESTLSRCSLAPGPGRSSPRRRRDADCHSCRPTPLACGASARTGRVAHRPRRCQMFVRGGLMVEVGSNSGPRDPSVRLARARIKPDRRDRTRLAGHD